MTQPHNNSELINCILMKHPGLAWYVLPTVFQMLICYNNMHITSNFCITLLNCYTMLAH